MADITPPELARLLDVGERPRSQGWSLRAALTRFGQPRAQLASDLTEVLRRLEGALKPYAETLQREGDAVWRAVAEGVGVGDTDERLVELLHVAIDLDAVADALAAWAADRTQVERPDAAVEAAVADLAGRLDALGVAREDRRPPAARRRGV